MRDIIVHAWTTPKLYLTPTDEAVQVLSVFVVFGVIFAILAAYVLIDIAIDKAKYARVRRDIERSQSR